MKLIQTLIITTITSLTLACSGGGGGDGVSNALGEWAATLTLTTNPSLDCPVQFTNEIYDFEKIDSVKTVTRVRGGELDRSVANNFSAKVAAFTLNYTDDDNSYSEFYTITFDGDKILGTLSYFIDEIGGPGFCNDTYNISGTKVEEDA